MHDCPSLLSQCCALSSCPFEWTKAEHPVTSRTPPPPPPCNFSSNSCPVLSRFKPWSLPISLWLHNDHHRTFSSTWPTRWQQHWSMSTRPERASRPAATHDTLNQDTHTQLCWSISEPKSLENETLTQTFYYTHNVLSSSSSFIHICTPTLTLRSHGNG